MQVGTAYNAWTSSLLLAKYLWLSSGSTASLAPLPLPPIPITSRSVLELGCGVGVVGFTAAMLGGNVTMSDFNDDVLRNVKEGLRMNGLEVDRSAVQVVRLEWGREGGGDSSSNSKQRWYGGQDASTDGNSDSTEFAHLEPDAQFDVVVAADCCYEPDHPRLLCRFFPHIIE
jgi:predicted nicotinamide N-methyase